MNSITHCRLVSLINFFNVVIINWIIPIVLWHAQKPRVPKIQTDTNFSSHCHAFTAFLKLPAASSQPRQSIFYTIWDTESKKINEYMLFKT